MIEISNFSFKYRESDQPVVSGIELTIPDGAFVGITGAAGSGKSTLTYALNGIIPHCYPGDFYGSVTVDGLDTCDVALTDVSRLVGSVCQDVDSQFVTSVVEDEMLYGLENFGVPRDEIEGRLEQALDDMGIADLRDRTITSLSGGQKQKVAIASILALNPRVLVLDEPTAGLDPAGRENLMANIRDYHRNKKRTIILVSHSMDEIARNVDRILVLKSAHVLMSGTPAEVFARAEELLSAGLDVPQVTRIAMRLREQGLAIDPAVYTVETLERELLALRRGETGC